MEDLNEAGGVYAVMNELTKKESADTRICMTVTGKTVGENIKDCMNKNPEVIRPMDNPYSETGGLAVLTRQPGTRLRRGKAFRSGSGDDGS